MAETSSESKIADDVPKFSLYDLQEAVVTEYTKMQSVFNAKDDILDAFEPILGYWTTYAELVESTGDDKPATDSKNRLDATPLTHQCSHGHPDCFEQPWKKGLSKELRDELTRSSKKMELTMSNINRRLQQADTHFRENGSGEDPFFLTTFEASTLWKHTTSLTDRVESLKTIAHLYYHIMQNRLDTLERVENGILPFLYNKIQTLIWYMSTKKFHLYGTALNTASANPDDIAFLKLQNEVQKETIGLLNAQFCLVEGMNIGYQKNLQDAINCFQGHLGGETSYDSGTPGFKMDEKEFDWQKFKNDLEKQKKAAKSAEMKRSAALAKASGLRGKKVLGLIKNLLDEVTDSSGADVADRLINISFGAPIDALPDSGEMAANTTFKEFISPYISDSITDIIDCNTLGEEFKELRQMLSLEDYSPKKYTVVPELGQKWVTVPLMDILYIRKEAKDEEKAASDAIRMAQNVQDNADAKLAQATKLKDLHDLHMFECKKAASKESKRAAEKENAILVRCSEFADKIADMMPCKPKGEKPWPMLTIDRKLQSILKAMQSSNKTSVQACIQVSKADDELRKQIASKDKALLEQEILLEKSRSSDSQKLQDMQAKINSLSLALEKKDEEIAHINAEANKVKKKYEAGFEIGNQRIAELKTQIATRKKECKNLQLDVDDSRSRMEKAEKALAEYELVVAAQESKYTTMKTKFDSSQSKMLSLRSNESHVLDRIQKAVGVAEGAKNIHIFDLENQTYELRGQVSDLEDQVQTLSQVRLAYEQEILDLRRVKIAQKAQLDQAQNKVARLESYVTAQKMLVDEVMTTLKFGEEG